MNKIIKLKGIPAAPGITIGKVYILDSEDLVIAKNPISEKDIPLEINRFKLSLQKTKLEITGIKDKILKELGSEHAEIFSAHLLVIEDTMLIEEVISKLKKEKFCVEYIFLNVLKKYVKAFSKMDDEYLKERISDINDVGRRILRNLLGAKHTLLSELKEKVVIVAYDLSPSDTAMMHKKNVVGFVTDIGGKTSHTAIMAKSLEIPAVVGLEEITKKAKNGDTIIIDGNRGIVILNPDSRTRESYEIEKEKYDELGRVLISQKDLPAETMDGYKIELAANIELPEEIPSAIEHGATGIGLYRTEYFYMNRTDLPTEEEHFEAYKYVAQKIAPNSVILRTLDLGGDKFLSQLEVPHEMNPFLGWRAIRFCLAKPEIFKTQLRAILRASVYGKLKIMYPMISGVEEVIQANTILNDVKEELRKKRIPFDDHMEVGAMIEIPSAALTSDVIAKEVDFFSIGTNDLIQYSLAVDRVNEKIAYLYEPEHPAVLRLIRTVIENGHKNNIWVGMCGEMASEPSLVLILLGLGLNEFSTSSIMVPEIKRIIRSITLHKAREIADAAMKLSTGKEVKEFARKKLIEIIPELNFQ